MQAVGKTVWQQTSLPIGATQRTLDGFFEQTR